MPSTSIIEINARCSDIGFRSCYSDLYIENKYIGPTPIQLFLPTGDYNYKLIKLGYNLPPPPPAPLAAGVMNIQYGLKFELNVDLINGNVSGGFSINSSPDGANIFVDGVDMKTTTPTIIAGLNKGEHKYLLKLPGYTDMEGSFTMTFGQTTSVYAVFTQLKDFGTLYIYPTPYLYGRIIPYIIQGAKIFIDNKDTGNLVPSSITGLTKGVHTFRIERPGTIDREGMFIINGGDTLLISTYPILETKTGMLIITTAPFVGDVKLARVFIDGKDTGQLTDVRYALPIGTHTYRLEYQGYENAEGKFDINENRITIVTPYMRQIGTIPFGEVNISSQPTGALVAINDVYLGQYTPTTVKNLSDGDYTYRLSRAGYADTTGTFTISNSQPVNLNPTMVQTNTILDISSNIIAAMIYIDGHTEGWTTPAEIVGLSPGEHTYRLIIPETYGNSFKDMSGTFKLETKKTTVINTGVNIAEEASKGNLIVNSVPIDAKVFIDDIDTKSVTPDTIIGMDTGIHSVKLTLEGHKDWIGSVNIISGSIVSIYETLVPEKV